jgi:hypothetical protein
MTALLKAAKKTPLPIDTSSAYDLSEKDFNHILQKLCIVKLAKISNGKLYPLDSSDHWLDLTSEEKSLYLYRHPLNNLLNSELSCKINSEKNIREAEKSVKRLLQKEWVFFDDFFKGILVPLSEDSVIVLKKTGRQWMYTQPRYTKEEASLLKSIIFEWLFEMGITIPGTCNNRDCFALTAFGKFFFNQ